MRALHVGHCVLASRGCVQRRAVDVGRRADVDHHRLAHGTDVRPSAPALRVSDTADLPWRTAEGTHSSGTPNGSTSTFWLRVRSQWIRSDGTRGEQCAASERTSAACVTCCMLHVACCKLRSCGVACSVLQSAAASAECRVQYKRAFKEHYQRALHAGCCLRAPSVSCGMSRSR